MTAAGSADATPLNVLGPSWSAMSQAQRLAYAPRDGASTPCTSLEAIGDLLDLVLDFPRAVRAEGLATIAWRWGASADVLDLAQLLDRDEAGPIALEPAPTRRPGRRATWERDLAFGREDAA